MSDIVFRKPTIDDGLPVWTLVRDGGVLDLNSTYAYCALFRHFADSCVIAEHEGEIAGFITGQRLPDRPDVLFVWQVGVNPDHRGKGIATRMLQWLIAPPHGEPAAFIETTITPSNTASRALFHGIARRQSTSCDVTPLFTAAHLGAGHEDEELFRIGPFQRTHA